MPDKRLSSSARAGAAGASAASSTANSEVACLISGPPCPGPGPFVRMRGRGTAPVWPRGQLRTVALRGAQ